MSSLQTGQRHVLLAAKCKALARGQSGDVVDGATAGSIPGGAALVSGDVAWVLAEDEPRRSLGAALAWAEKHGARELHLFASADAGSLARRAAMFELRVTVSAISGTELVRATAEPLPVAPPLDPLVHPFRAMFESAGAEAVVDGGVLRAEVRGLEVARVELAEDESGRPVARLAVGVGKHDRYAHREVHGDSQDFDQLFEVVRIVTDHRVAGGDGHAAFHLAGERWLRWVVIRNPELVGARELRIVGSSDVRDDLREAAPAAAAGEQPDGSPILVVCSVGFDSELVPHASDAWLADGRHPRLVLCLPVGDDHRATRALAALLSLPGPDGVTNRAEVVTLPRNWREW